MRTAEICPTCATYINALCVLFDGPLLETLNIEPLDDLDTALVKIEAWASALEGTGTSINVPYILKIELTPSQLQNIGTTQVVLIPFPSLTGSINDYEIIVTDIIYYSEYGTIPYDSNVLEIGFNGGVTISNSLNLSYTSDVNTWRPLSTYEPVPGASIVARGTDSVGLGDSPLQVHLTYKIINIT